MDEQRTPPLEERFRPTLDEAASPLTLLRASGGLGIALLALLLLGLRESDAALRTLCLIWAGALLLLLLLVLLLGRRYRCTMSPAGVSLGKAQLAWVDVRTAAVIHRSQLPPISARKRRAAVEHYLGLTLPAVRL